MSRIHPDPEDPEEPTTEEKEIEQEIQDDIDLKEYRYENRHKFPEKCCKHTPCVCKLSPEHAKQMKELKSDVFSYFLKKRYNLGDK